MKKMFRIIKTIKLYDITSKLCKCGANENIYLDCDEKHCKYMGSYDNEKQK